MDKLEKARIEIDKIDKSMAELFEKRMKCVEDVIDFKLENNLPILNTNRESEVIKKNSDLIENPLYTGFYERFIKQLMDISKLYQNTRANKEIIGYQGSVGAFSQIALKKLFPLNRDVSYPTFEDVFKAVEMGDIEYGVLPFENSYTGEVGEVLDLLLKYDCHITNVYSLKIEHHLLALDGTELDDITHVYSHPQALMQCEDYLNKKKWTQVPYPNTALSGKFVSKQENKHFAAIGSYDTAKENNLVVLKESINSSNHNHTKFIVIHRNMMKEGNRFNVMFTTSHEPGCLADVMKTMGELNFNIESIKSRSIRNKPWAYYFYAELVGSPYSSNGAILIEKMNEKCDIFKVIGIYDVNKE
jgi:chorismate mutase/prephenate dehydratase